MDYRSFFGPDSPLASVVANYAPRPQQQAMAEAVGEALDALQTLVVEAGTGIGKTFAYLVPALTSGRRVIVSTGTRNLQDQLFERDLPTITRAIGRPVTVALLKGRSNYLCLYRLALAREQSPDDATVATVRDWAQITRTGDRAELRAVPEEAPVWPRVTSTVDNCLGSDCPRYEDCHVVAARRAAQAADVVVVNHHLLLADFALKEEGFGELLPGADAFIIDEAHQLPDVAAQFFGVAVSSRQISNLVRDTVAELLEAGHRDEHWRQTGAALERAVGDLRLQWGERQGRESWQGSAAKLASLRAVGEALDALEGKLQALAGSSNGLDNCRERTLEIAARLSQFDPEAGEPVEGLRWVDARGRGLSLHLTPFNVAERIGELITQLAGAWVLTSATLAVGEDFSHFLGRIGISDVETLRLDSPFDFSRNALLYLPKKMPQPSDPDYVRAVCERARPVINAAGGGAFVLFTSHRSLREAARLFGGQGVLSLGHPVLVQGETPRAALLERFSAHGNAVLLGTSSFWEGVDVRGAALRLVIIDKLPFAAPGDPLMQARLEAIRRAGGNPFSSYQLPQAVLTLKQGVGRLIRDHRDRGVAMICDPRLQSRSYGRVFLASLPPMPVTDDVEEAAGFFADFYPLGREAPA